MGDFPPRVFDFGKPAVCQQPFRYGDKNYSQGEPFPYEQFGLTKFQMHGFWLASLVDFQTAPALPTKKPDKRAAR
jgi:hypothetical protein